MQWEMRKEKGKKKENQIYESYYLSMMQIITSLIF